MAEVEVENEVRMVLDRIVDALNSADAEALAPLLADRPGSVHIGSDPNEWWSKDQLVHGIQKAMAAGGTQVRPATRPGVSKVSERPRGGTSEIVEGCLDELH